MQIKQVAYLALGVLWAASAGAQDQPLSVIDWVKRHPDKPAMTSAVLPKRFEPPVSPDATVPEVSVTPLDGQARQIIGLVPASVTGLPEALWTGSTADAVHAQLRELPDLRLPAAQALLYTVLLTEALGPGSDAKGDDLLTLARVEALNRFGAPDPALALLEQANPTRDRAHFRAYMDAALLTGQEDTACAIQAAHPHLAPSVAHRSYCAARAGDWPTGALLYDTGRSLGAIDGAHADALERFLHPESFEDAAPLPRPDDISPLLFRVHEAIGEPLPTRFLSPAYAVADLRDLAGWKAQLEAAERLAVTGALPANRLLGLYTARQPAASGGIWDRVQAVQRFETALRTRSSEAISKTLGPAWQGMQQAGLELIFADLFATALARYNLSGAAGQIAAEMALLSTDYAQLADQYAQEPFLQAIASGKTQGLTAKGARQSTILAGFDTQNARRDLTDMARNGRMGEAILRALSLLDDGAAGDPVALSQALATLRAFGLEDTVRRAALQILLLQRYS